MARVCVTGYVPPPSFKGAKSFLENLSRNQISGEYFFLSEHREYGFGDKNLLGHPPELNAAVMEKKTPRLSNLVFLSCLRVASQRGYTHMLYIESDCRFKGNGWDAIMFEEFFSLPFPALAGGSVTAHSMINGGGEFYRRFSQYFKEKQKNLPLPVFGIQALNVPGAAECFKDGEAQVIAPGDSRAVLRNVKPSLYPNGAIGIYDIAMCREIFGMNPDGSWKKDYNGMMVVSWPAWDYVIGMALYDKFGSDVFDVVAHLETCWSSYGDSLSTEAERLQMLRDGVCRGVHQVKGEIAE